MSAARIVIGLSESFFNIGFAGFFFYSFESQIESLNASLLWKLAKDLSSDFPVRS